MTDAIRTAVALGQLTGISFSTCAVMAVEEFDKIAEDPAMPTCPGGRHDPRRGRAAGVTRGGL